jgi:hypothetical protein
MNRLQTKSDEAVLQNQINKKIKELAKSPDPMILARVAQILGGFVDIRAKIVSLQQMAHFAAELPKTGPGVPPLSPRTISKLTSHVPRAPSGIFCC